jgi:hypothetical protein
MSYGYYRTPSEAMRKGRRPTRLVRLDVQECSIVDRAANPLAKVAIIKRDGGTAMSLQQQIEKSFALRSRGELSDSAFCIKSVLKSSE